MPVTQRRRSKQEARQKLRLRDMRAVGRDINGPKSTDAERDLGHIWP